jgi:hypothetical protein
MGGFADMSMRPASQRLPVPLAELDPRQAVILFARCVQLVKVKY